MGGYGSTRWNRHRRKTTVEECLVLSIGELLRKGISSTAPKQHDWLDPRSRGVIACMFYKLDVAVPERLRLWIYVGSRTDTGLETFERLIDLQSTHFGRYGSARWWFTCLTCERRCAKIYLPPSGTQFACRECHDLTYGSCQKSHSFSMLDRALAKQVGIPLNQAKRHWDRMIPGSRKFESA